MRFPVLQRANIFVQLPAAALALILEKLLHATPWTLVELLMVIGIVSVLLALVVPAILIDPHAGPGRVLSAQLLGHGGER